MNENLRFEFGANWSHFLENFSEERLREAAHSLETMLEVNDLRGKRFLDIGSGSGLFSLAARRLGARVHSFDYDTHSVSCTSRLRDLHFPDDGSWTIERGDVLDSAYVQGLGAFDVVYSWGVLHHTGAMWSALENALVPLANGGKLFIAIYNHMGGPTDTWRRIKRGYNMLPRPLRVPYTVAIVLPIELLSTAEAALEWKLAEHLRGWINPRHGRGMRWWNDWVDWVGGYPYEAAKPEEVVAFCRARGVVLSKLTTCGGGHGCNEYVLERNVSARDA